MCVAFVVFFFRIDIEMNSKEFFIQSSNDSICLEWKRIHGLICKLDETKRINECVCKVKKNTFVNTNRTFLPILITIKIKAVSCVSQYSSNGSLMFQKRMITTFKEARRFVLKQIKKEDRIWV